MKLNNISKCFYINLEERKDRQYHCKLNINFDCIRSDAISFRDVVSPNPKISNAEYACYLSHLNIWKQIKKEKISTTLVLEDDVVLSSNFADDWNKNYCHFIPENFDIIYFGGCLNSQHYHKIIKKHNIFFNTIKVNNFFEKQNKYWHMTTEAYLLSYKFCDKLLQLIAASDFSAPLDHFMSTSVMESQCYHLHSLPIYQNSLLFSSIQKKSV